MKALAGLVLGGMLVSAFICGMIAIWTEDDRWAATALLLAAPTLLLAMYSILREAASRG